VRAALTRSRRQTDSRQRVVAGVVCGAQSESVSEAAPVRRELASWRAVRVAPSMGWCCLRRRAYGCRCGPPLRVSNSRRAASILSANRACTPVSDACLCVCPVCLRACLPTMCLSMCLYLCLSVCLSVALSPCVWSPVRYTQRVNSGVSSINNPMDIRAAIVSDLSFHNVCQAWRVSSAHLQVPSARRTLHHDSPLSRPRCCAVTMIAAGVCSARVVGLGFCATALLAARRLPWPAAPLLGR
jgi:hypothetical protein